MRIHRAGNIPVNIDRAVTIAVGITAAATITLFGNAAYKGYANDDSPTCVAVHYDDLSPYTQKAMEDVRLNAPAQSIVLSYESLTINVVADELLPEQCDGTITEDQILIWYGD